jgi:hypothetical protein
MIDRAESGVGVQQRDGSQSRGGNNQKQKLPVLALFLVVVATATWLGLLLLWFKDRQARTGKPHHSAVVSSPMRAAGYGAASYPPTAQAEHDAEEREVLEQFANETNIQGTVSAIVHLTCGAHSPSRTCGRFRLGKQGRVASAGPARLQLARHSMRPGQSRQSHVSSSKPCCTWCAMWCMPSGYFLRRMSLAYTRALATCDGWSCLHAVRLNTETSRRTS